MTILVISSLAAPCTSSSSRGTEAPNETAIATPGRAPCIVDAFKTGAPPVNDWSPACLSTGSMVQVQAGDNQGTLITGIDATGMSVGDERTICNANGTADAGVIAWSVEDASSLPNNRIWLAHDHKTTFEDRIYQGTGDCLTFVYTQPNQSNPATYRWLVRDGRVRQNRLTVQNLELFPWIVAAGVTGTNDDWAPVDTEIYPQAGGTGSAIDYTMILASTADVEGATLTGLASAGSGNLNSGKGEGATKCIYNDGPGVIRLTSEDSASHSYNRFLLPDDVAITIQVHSTRCFWSEGGAWTLLGQALSGEALSATHVIKGGGTGGTTNELVNSAIVDDGTSTSVGPLSVLDSSAATSVVNESLMSLRPTGAGVTDPAPYNMLVQDFRTFDTSSSPISYFNTISLAEGTRSAGENDLTQVALYADARGGQRNEAIETGCGDLYFGAGCQSSTAYVNTARLDTSAEGIVETTLGVGGGDFTGTTRQQLAEASILPRVTHGTLSSDSSNFIGRITGISASSTTLIFGGSGFSTTAHCFIQGEGDSASPIGFTVRPSNTAPIIMCWRDGAGLAVPCPDLSYQCWGH
ncbi:MAG TPA: hypothetical protein VGL61_34630 [Kofleriaceae bacterium]